MNKWVKRMSLTLAAALSVAMLGGCGAKEKAQVNVAALNGPTGIGMVKLMEDNDAGAARNAYTVTLAGAPDDIVGKLTSGEVDIAAVPTNLAATLYQKTKGNIQVLAARPSAAAARAARRNMCGIISSNRTASRT